MIPLPEPEVIHTVMPDDYRYGHVRGFTRSQMLSYGRACAAAERERCAKVLKLAWGALVQCSPCADPECKQEQQEWLDLAIKSVDAAIRELKDE